MQVTLAFAEAENSAASIGKVGDLVDIFLIACTELSDGDDHTVAASMTEFVNLGNGYYSVNIAVPGDVPAYCRFQYDGGSFCDITVEALVATLANGPHGGVAATFQTAAGVLSQESVPGTTESAATDSALTNFRDYYKEFLHMEEWYGVTATVTPALEVGQSISIYKVPIDPNGGSIQKIANINHDGSVTYREAGVPLTPLWGPGYTITDMCVLRVEHFSNGQQMVPVDVVLTILADAETQNGSTVTFTLPGTNVAGDERCYYVRPDGTLVRCGGATIMPDTRLTEAGVRSAVGLATANLDTQLAEVKGLAAAGGASTVIVSTEQE